MSCRTYSHVVRFTPIIFTRDFPVELLQRSPGSKNVRNLHFHDELEIGYCFDGSGLFIHFDEVVPYQSGDMVIVYPGQPHVIISSNGAPSYWEFLMIDVERLFQGLGVADYKPIADVLSRAVRAPNFIRHGTHEDFCTVFKEALSEYKNEQLEYSLSVTALLWSFLLKLTRLSEGERQEANVENDKNFMHISPAINYITSNFSQNIDITLLCQLCFLSKANFERKFRKVMKLTPLSYIRQVRIRMASMLLKTTDLPILEIASEVGYKSISSFNRNFDTVKKISPRDYRKKYR